VNKKTSPSPLQSDGGVITDAVDKPLLPDDDKMIRELFKGVDAEKIDRFMELIKTPLSMYTNHRSARTEIVNNKEHARWLEKLRNQVERFLKEADKLSSLLCEVPFELRRAASGAGTPIESIQNDIVVVMSLLNNIDTSKSKTRPETKKAIESIGEAFESSFGVRPLAAAFHGIEDVKDNTLLPRRFVPVVALALHLSVDHAYRLVRACGYMHGDDIDSQHLQLLTDIHSVFDGGRMHSADLVQRLIGIEHQPLAKSERKLAAMLKAFDISPEQLRINGKNRRGYRRTAFKSAWSTYLPRQKTS